MLEEAALALEQPEIPCGVRFGTLKKWKKRKDAFLHPPNPPPIHLLGNTTIQFRRENTRGLSGPCRAAPF